MFGLDKAEVYCGSSFNDFTGIKDILCNGKISYTYKIVDQFQETCRRFGKFETNEKYDNLYYVYVKKCDYEQAHFLLTQNNIR
jgi:hypothetical protein